MMELSGDCSFVFGPQWNPRKSRAASREPGRLLVQGRWRDGAVCRKGAQFAQPGGGRISGIAWMDAKTVRWRRRLRIWKRIVVDNEREAWRSNKIHQKIPAEFNVVLRRQDLPYISSRAEKYPRVYFTRRIKKDGSIYFDRFFPRKFGASHMHFVHKRSSLPSCT